MRGLNVRRLETAGLSLQDHEPQGISRDGTAGVHKAEVTDLHEALGQDMLEESADKVDGIELGGTLPCTSGFTICESDGAVLEGDDTTIGDGDFEDIGGEVFERYGPIWIGLAVDIPGDFPALWVDVVEESSALHLLFEDGLVDGRECFNGDKEVVSGREPLGVVSGESTTWDNIVNVGVVLELSAPGVEDAGKAREFCTDETPIFGEPFEGLRRRLEQGLIGDLLMRPNKRSEGVRDREGDEEVGARELFLQMVLEP